MDRRGSNPDYRRHKPGLCQLSYGPHLERREGVEPSAFWLEASGSAAELPALWCTDRDSNPGSLVGNETCYRYIIHAVVEPQAELESATRCLQGSRSTN